MVYRKENDFFMVTNFDIHQYNNYFFIGIGGSGMSAIAQYLSGIGKQLAGSDRQFFEPNNKTQKHLEALGIKCFIQDGSGISDETEVVVVSSAIEETNIEYQKAKEKSLIIVKRAELLAAITKTKKTIAIAGTSGKSTSVAMLFHILHKCAKQPSLITGAGLIELQEENKIGNSYVGNGEWLIIEADESDGSLVNYHPEIGVILNIDKDHKSLCELKTIFAKFKDNTQNFVLINASQKNSAALLDQNCIRFGYEPDFQYVGSDFRQTGFQIRFKINGVDFTMPIVGKHNMENALAAVSVACLLGVSLPEAASALLSYRGIYRRHQIIGSNDRITVIDDFAHNPAKISASIRAYQHLSKHLIIWFQPHGFSPTKLLKHEYIEEISAALRNEDTFFISEIYYAGGNVVRNISSKEIAEAIVKKGKNAIYLKEKEKLTKKIRPLMRKSTIVLLMGARDPHLNDFAKHVFKMLDNTVKLPMRVS